MTNSRKYLDILRRVADSDVAGLKKAEESYGDSWKRRGGIGAFMMLARKWDRLERRCETVPKKNPVVLPVQNLPSAKFVRSEGEGDRFDIFCHIDYDPRSEGVIDDIRDLRRYLMLVEAEMIARGSAAAVSDHRDNDLVQEYVVLLVFDESHEHIILIKKDRGPAMVVGHWNGLGGKIEDGETPQEAMSRETREEAGIAVDPRGIQMLCALEGNGYRVHFGHTYLDNVVFASYATEETEEVRHFPIDRLPDTIMHNLRWMIPLATDSQIAPESYNIGTLHTTLSV